MKKLLGAGLVAVTILVASSLPGEAWHGHGQIIVAPGWWGPVWVEPYPYYVTPPPAIVVPPAPPAYVEPPQSARYFCEEPRGYYPDVSQCPGGWKHVLPAAPPGP